MEKLDCRADFQLRAKVATWQGIVEWIFSWLRNRRPQGKCPAVFLIAYCNDSAGRFPFYTPDTMSGIGLHALQQLLTDLAAVSRRKPSDAGLKVSRLAPGTRTV